MPEKIELRYGSWRAIDFITLGFPSIMIAFIGFTPEKGMSSIIMLVLCGAAVIYFGISLLRRFNDKSVRVGFSELGIRIVDEDKLIPWNTISNVEIGSAGSGLLDRLDTILSITIESKYDLDDTTIEITEYDFNKEQILAYCRSKIDQYFDQSNKYIGDDDDDEEA